MATDPPSQLPSQTPAQPSHLTLTELAFNYALFAAVGYCFAGRIGVCVGLAVLTARYGYLIWVAASSLPVAVSSEAVIPQASEKRPPHGGFQNRDDEKNL